MAKSETITEITKAIVAVMVAVKGIEKNLTVGSGKSAYQGVSDKDVKNAVGKAMEDNGLVIAPIEIDATVKMDRWEEADSYNNGAMKTKQSVFTEVKTKYLLLHVSGEWIEISGYGHGVDSQDKSAGKATTYAMKNTLLYTFMVPTGKIDDADAEHSDDKEVPKVNSQAVKKSATDAAINKAVERILNGETDLISKMKETFVLNESQSKVLEVALENYSKNNKAA